MWRLDAEQVRIFPKFTQVVGTGSESLHKAEPPIPCPLLIPSALPCCLKTLSRGGLKNYNPISEIVLCGVQMLNT